MELGFDTESVKHAKAALILYAMYKSRSATSPLNGLETWNRFMSYIHGASRKSSTTAEFCQHFCHSAKIESIKPTYLKTGLVKMSDGSIVFSEDIKDFKLDIMADNTLLTLFENEGLYLSMLVRERIQREKMETKEITEEETDEY